MALSRKTRSYIGAAVMLVGLCLIGAGVVWTVPDYLISASYQDVAAKAKVEARPDEGEKKPEATEDEPAEVKAAPVGIDWNYLKGVNPASSAWISVPAKSIDFPVMHGRDNEYYLHHDMHGRWGYGGVFSDYRCDPNGRNVIVYGHTLIGGGMFTKLGRADEAGQLATIGSVTYSTPEAGATEFTPIATLHVRPSFQDVQQFEWDVDDTALEAAKRDIARARAAKGEWSVEMPSGQTPAGDYLIDWYRTQDASVMVDGQSVGVGRFYTSSSVSDADAMRIAEKGAWRDWLIGLVEQSTQTSPDVVERIASANRSLVLSCCSWPFDSHRTLTVCVA